MILSPVLAELLTGSTPLSGFASLSTLALFLFLGYGVPVLLIRELSIHRSLSTAGVFVIGAGYGLFNEGLLAKTVLKAEALPLNGFDHYGVMLGISVPWAITISVWHAASAVVYPVALSHLLNPDRARTPWIPPRWSLLAALSIAGLATFGFLRKDGGSALQCLLLWAAIAAFFAVGLQLRRRERERSTALRPGAVLPMVAGVTTTVVLLFLNGLAENKIPVAVFLVTLSAFVAGYIRLIRRSGWDRTACIVLFGLGSYIPLAAIGVLARVSRSPAAALESSVTAMLLILAIGIWSGKARRALRTDPEF